MPFLGNKIMRCCVLMGLAVVLLVLVHMTTVFWGGDRSMSMVLGPERTGGDLESHKKVSLYILVLCLLMGLIWFLGRFL